MIFEPTDRPIARQDQDLLERRTFIETLAKALVTETEVGPGMPKKRNATGYVVGLTGEWGSGKSSILNLLAEHLGTLNNVIVVSFNPWLFKSLDDLLNGFFNELASKLGKTKLEKFRDLTKTLDKYRDAISAGVRTLPGGGIADPLLGAALKHETLSAVESRRELEKKIAQTEGAIVVLIDELDRVENKEIRAVARLIKAVGDIKGISYLVAYDLKRVSQALGGKSNDEKRQRITGEAYLEKVIQLNVPIRPMLDYEVRNLFQKALELRGYTSLDLDRKNEEDFFKILTQTVSTPRDIKRIVGNFAAIEPMVRGELNALDLLGYSYLLAKAPSLREIIAKDYDAVVDDPAEIEAIRRAASKQQITVESVFGTEDDQHARILRWLFPALGAKSRIEFDRDRIRKRRNLLRLLYLGNPPHDVPRALVESIWECSDGSTEAQLRALIGTNRLRAFVDRFIDLFPTLRPKHDATFWPALAQSLVRNHDWISGPEPQRAVIDDLEDLLRTSANATSSSSDRAKEIVEKLIQAGDLQIAPAILRSHIYKYGLVSGATARDFMPVIFDLTETKSLVERELPRYKTAITDGHALRRLIDIDLIYLLLNLNLYESSLREAVTNQLRDPMALATFASLIVPPGYAIGQDTLQKLIDVDVTRKRLIQYLDEGRFSQMHEWVRVSLNNLNRFMNGKSPFDDDD